MDKELVSVIIPMLFMLVVGIALGFHIAKEIFIDRFWKVSHVNRKHFYKTQYKNEFLCDRITNMYYDGIFYGTSVKKLEEKAQEPEIIFVVTK